MIIKTTQCDFPHIWRLTKRFNDKYFGIPLEFEKFHRWFHLVLDHGIILHSEAGYIAGFPVEDPVRNWTALVENAWYSEDRTGLTLLKQFIEHGKELGVNEVRMTTLNTTPVGAITLLERMGFEEIERSHRLTL